MTAITSTGLGSGLDINSIVTAIVDAEKDPALASMTSAAAAATAAISAYGVLNSELSAFKDSYEDLSRSSTFSAATSSSSDSGILNATLGIGAATGSWSFEVEQQAKAQTIVSSSANSYTESASEVGTGTISFSYGSYETDGSFSINPDKAIETLTIDASNNSLGELRDAINEGDYSVSASIIDDGSNYRLVLTNKETGEENAMQLTVVDDDGDNSDATGLSALTYSADVKNMDQTSTAQDAKIIMNGIEITRSTNEISSVIEGVTLNIGGETEVGETVSLTITQDTSAVEDQINAFVENYNNTITQMNSLTAYGGESGSDGALNGDSTVRNIQNQMRAVLNTTVSHSGGVVQSFADLGMLTNLDGTLSLDADTLTAAMNNDMESIANFFTASGGASDSLIDFESKSTFTVPGTYELEVTKLATQGVLTNSAPTMPFTIDSSNDTFKIRLDGFLSNDIVLSAGTYNTMEEYTTELQSKINSDANFVENDLNMSILESAGVLSFTSNSYGSSSTVAITEVENASLGLTVGGGINGEDVEGLIAGVVASGEGQYLLSNSGDSQGLKVQVNGGVLGDRGTVTYSQGMSSMFDDMLDGVIDSNISSSEGDTGTSGTTIDGKIDSLYKKIASLEEQEESLTYKMDKLETRLYTQFNAMDIAVSSLNNTMSYLESTLDALPGYSND
ncbi:flagellar filament capping protein FliD [uncultured Psychromonas sp.]|uniref:flagellar filament capping protein FliD n=1 Tax=uncultured Psychromonas sp. TaxID=173974 RepID=UPI0026194CCD|nr:flagellar filament capping protein FliD [uncultured Psychromonas sp.]